MPKIILFFLIAFFYFYKATEVLAVTTPSFLSCSSPQGIIKVNYSSGNHGIVGDPSSYLGSDTVYKLTDTTLSQCFCSDDGNGIQTNWWKVASLTEDQVEILKRDDWIYIPNGALWDLENTPYLAKHSKYGCQGTQTGSATLAASSNVLGIETLASTGGMTLFYLMNSSGIILLLIGFYGQRLSNNKN